MSSPLFEHQQPVQVDCHARDHDVGRVFDNDYDLVDAPLLVVPRIAYDLAAEWCVHGTDVFPEGLKSA